MDIFEDPCFVPKELMLLPDFQASPTDSDTLCSSCSSNELSINFDQEMDNQLEKFSFESSENSEKAQKKKGRRPQKSQKPSNRLSETIENYWVRNFRNFLKSHLERIRFVFNEREMQFWSIFVSKSCKTNTKEKFLTKTKENRSFLREEKSFGMVFKAWFVEYGEEELMKKFQKGTDLWFTYYEYAIIELARDGKGFEIVRKALRGEVGSEMDDSEVFFHIINKKKA